MPHPKHSPFVEHVGVVIEEQRAGFSGCALAVAPHHFNTFGVVHGGVMFTLADTGMGAALGGRLQVGHYTDIVYRMRRELTDEE
jgi:acyl-CoA thioesterase